MLADTAPPDDIAQEASIIPPARLRVSDLHFRHGWRTARRDVAASLHPVQLPRCIRTGAVRYGSKMRFTCPYLPLSHSYEHTVGNFFFASLGTEIVYSRGVEHLAADMLAIRPTILTAVPRVLEVIRGRVMTQVARQPPWKQRLFSRAMDIGDKRSDGFALSLLERLIDPILDHLVRAKIRDRFGGRLKAAVSGGARLEPDVGRFFLALGLVLLQGYGQTEAGPVISATPPEAIRIDTVGLPLIGVDLRLAEDGEDSGARGFGDGRLTVGASSGHRRRSSRMAGSTPAISAPLTQPAICGSRIARRT